MTARSRARIFLLVFVCLVALAGFSQGCLQKKTALAPADETYFRRLAMERPGKEIRSPDFVLEDLGGKRLGPSDFRGRVVFLNFWATWCVPCREEMPSMERLQREFRGEGLEVVAVNFQESEKEVRKFLHELGLTFTVLLDKEGKVSEEYGAWAIPLSYLINRRGQFIAKVNGSRDWDSQDARAFLLELLRQKS